MNNNQNKVSSKHSIEKIIRSLLNGMHDFVELFTFALLAIFLLSTFICRHSVVVGPSMQKTLENGEHLIISDLFYTPHQGDIVVFQDITKSDKAMVKRIIAVGGQHVQVTKTAVFVDGQKLNEDYVYLDAERMPEFHECEITVPQGYLFVMGDHRNNSTDSSLFGVIDERSVLGKAWIRLMPFTIFK